ncbi:Ig-like domain repeat protein [Virgisporangium aurantiacum]|uniref:Bacterial Ig-like domain-containing protein n=1 Tax=Virgisporangium aurantiacum TaxID=175570 RepID=A0A8J3YYV3_9ACTN|nr:Ig-like domain repeat protein [Virgisporangium aurantiacum]GIJ54209.1 hypothetical protein Vau01_017250 [Virgisporangium aurantiacum]
MTRRLLTRAVTVAAGAIVAAGALVVVATPAQAAPLGTVNLSQQSGTVTATPIFASATTSVACPATFGEEAALRIGPANTGPFTNLAPSLGGGGYDQSPVTVNPNRSFQTALGQAPADGEWWVVVECFSLTAGRHPDRFVTPIFVQGGTWTTTPPAGAEATSTALSASPTSPQPAGTPITLTATVTPAAAGSVQFFRADVSLGTATVTGGTAVLSNVVLPDGVSALTAAFTPADPAAFKASTSAALNYSVTPAGGQSVSQPLNATIEAGAFSIESSAAPVALAGTVGGSATGSLNDVTVTDYRGTNAGWNVTGQFPGFTQQGGSGAIPAGNLSWAPSGNTTSGGGTVQAGPSANLGAPTVLCRGSEGDSAGVFACDAGLTLTVPGDTVPGTYTGTLTLTLI